jgi:hypothetical protein
MGLPIGAGGSGGGVWMACRREATRSPAGNSFTTTPPPHPGVSCFPHGTFVKKKKKSCINKAISLKISQRNWLPQNILRELFYSEDLTKQWNILLFIQ